MRYTEHGILLPDNNALERLIRPVALGRANWLFAGPERGARATATMYSLIGRARLNGIEPYGWLKDALDKLPGWPASRVHEMLPLAWPATSTSEQEMHCRFLLDVVVSQGSAVVESFSNEN